MLAGAKCVAVVGRRQVSVLGMARGETLWTRGLEGQAASRGAARAAAGGDLLAIASASGPAADRLTCFNLRNGAEVWSVKSAPVRHLLFREGMLFARGAALTALDGRTGRRCWSLPAAGCSPATFANDKLYLVAGSGGVVTLDPATGVALGHASSMSSCGGVTVAGRMGYLRTADGVLRAIRLAGEMPGESGRQG
jgi:outer membrane protein assembly factor BamB